MPTPSSNPEKDKTVTPSSQTVPTGDDALRADWKKLSKGDQDKYFSSLSAQEQDQFATRVGMFDSKGPVSVSAPPKTGSIPWMKQKALATLNWGANQLPTVGGVAGGIVGTALGELADPIGGGIPGAIIGSGVGGGAGEAQRQFIQHKTGYDQFEDPKTLGSRAKDVVKEGAGQAASEATGQLLGKWLRPTLERSLAKLYYAGGIKYGNPLGQGDLETVANDLMRTEKAGGKATTVGDFLGVIKQAKNDIGQNVDRQMAIPFTQNGKIVPLGKAEADSTPIVNAINSMATADPSIVKEAKLNKAGKEAAYLEHIRQEALKFSQQPWTYEELMSKRIRLNNELAPLYTLPPGEQRVYLLDHPNLAVAKAQADAIRDVVYPQMDIISGSPMGTTAELQGKRGALMSIENQVNDHLSNIKTKARQAHGAPLTEKANISSYGTSSGKPGFAIHRLTSLVHTPNPERAADKKVAQAFGNTIGSKVRSAVTTPAGSEKLGNELLSMPLRELVNPSAPKQKKDDSSDDQSSVARPKDLIEKAKKLNPTSKGQVAYNHVYEHGVTGHRIGTNDHGKTWYDVNTGVPFNG